VPFADVGEPRPILADNRHGQLDERFLIFARRVGRNRFANEAAQRAPSPARRGSQPFGVCFFKLDLHPDHEAIMPAENDGMPHWRRPGILPS